MHMISKWSVFTTISEGVSERLVSVLVGVSVRMTACMSMTKCLMVGIPNHKHSLNEFSSHAPGPSEIHMSDMAFEA